jgi:hypothetical protein
VRVATVRVALPCRGPRLLWPAHGDRAGRRLGTRYAVRSDDRDGREAAAMALHMAGAVVLRVVRDVML